MHQQRKGCFNTFDKAIFSYKGIGPMSQSTIVNYSHCPARFYSSYWASFINMQDQFSQGIMPYEGTQLDQPALIVEAMNLIHNLKEETRFKHEETMRKYGKQRSKR